MSVEREALNAAIGYANKLEQELEWMTKKFNVICHERDSIRQTLREVSRKCNTPFERSDSSMPMEPEATKCCRPPQPADPDAC